MNEGIAFYNFREPKENIPQFQNNLQHAINFRLQDLILSQMRTNFEK